MDASPAPTAPAGDGTGMRRGIGRWARCSAWPWAMRWALPSNSVPNPALPCWQDLEAGGPRRLARGQWTDDTAMALALADSLHHDPALDASDLMRRFVDWHERGTYSCTGVCFDIGNATRAALDRFRRTGSALAGSPDPDTAGNGALMRLAPVAIRHWRDRAELGPRGRGADSHDPCRAGHAACIRRLRHDASRRDRRVVVEHRAGVRCRGTHRRRLARPAPRPRPGLGLCRACAAGRLWAVARTGLPLRRAPGRQPRRRR